MFLYRAGRVEESLSSYRRAVKLVEQTKAELPLIRFSLAQSLLQIRGRETATEALDNLKIVADYEPRTPRTWRLMATAYGRLDDFGGANDMGPSKTSFNFDVLEDVVTETASEHKRVRLTIERIAADIRGDRETPNTREKPRVGAELEIGHVIKFLAQ